MIPSQEESDLPAAIVHFKLEDVTVHSDVVHNIVSVSAQNGIKIPTVLCGTKLPPRSTTESPKDYASFIEKDGKFGINCPLCLEYMHVSYM